MAPITITTANDAHHKREHDARRPASNEPAAHQEDADAREGDVITVSRPIDLFDKEEPSRGEAAIMGAAACMKRTFVTVA